MSDKMRYRHGNTNPVMSAVDSATVIEIGDLVYLGADAEPASSLPHNGSRENDQLIFTEWFLGVAMQRSRVGDTDEIRVATTGVFEFDCTSGIYELGQHVGVEGNSEETALLNQQVAAVSRSHYAIGRIAKRATTSANTVQVDICSTVMRGGVAGTTRQ